MLDSNDFKTKPIPFVTYSCTSVPVNINSYHSRELPNDLPHTSVLTDVNFVYAADSRRSCK